ncbi:MAG: tetratricopeptide repeat protein [Candidatus Eremiobacteraeota bacterium]|nr:tetratricopeptide repeat protein [Candidatus Eremiobacteraeota bacterium]
MIHHRFGRCTFDPDAGSIRCDGHEVRLTAKSAELLSILLAHPNDVVSSEILRERLWPSGFVEPGNLPQQVYVLRRALVVDRSISIENVARRGYRLRANIPLLQAASNGDLLPQRPRSLVAAGLAAAALLVLPAGAAFVGRDANAHAFPGSRTYALGRYFWEKRGADNLLRAESYFRQTISLAPNSALGYAGISEVWAVRADSEMNPRRSATLARHALGYAETAVAKDGDSGVAHAALGLALMETKHETKGVAELRRAIALDPENPEAHEWYAIQVLVHGDVRTASQHFEAAAELQPENVAITTWRAWARYYLRDFDRAAADFRTALDLNPTYDMARIGLAATLLQRGAYRELNSVLHDVHPHDWSTSRALRALGAIADLRLGLRRNADAEAGRLQAEARKRLSDDDELVVAALALDGRRTEARQLRARMHLQEYERRIIDMDPLVGPVFRRLGRDG